MNGIENMEILDGIPVLITLEEVKAKLKKGDWDRVQRLLEEKTPLIRPKAVFRISVITEKNAHAVGVDGVLLKSRVLGYHLEEGVRVFPFVVTIGDRLPKQASESETLIEKFYLDTIGNLALNKTRRYLKEYLKDRYAFPCLSHLSPGSLADWPIEEQTTLFSIMNGAETAIGVALTPQRLMTPIKTVSGIYFPTHTPFQSCQLCPQKPCAGRRAAYSEKLFKEYGLTPTA